MSSISSREALHSYLALVNLNDKSSDGDVASSLANAANALEVKIPSQHRFEVALDAFLPLISQEQDPPSRYASTDAAAAAYFLVHLYRQHSPLLNPFESSVSLWLSQAQRGSHTPELQRRVEQLVELRASQHQSSRTASVSCKLPMGISCKVLCTNLSLPVQFSSGHQDCDNQSARLLAVTEKSACMVLSISERRVSNKNKFLCCSSLPKLQALIKSCKRLSCQYLIDALQSVKDLDDWSQEWLKRFEHCWSTIARFNPHLVTQWAARRTDRHPSLLASLADLPLAPWSCNILVELRSLLQGSRRILNAMDEFISLHAALLAERARDPEGEGTQHHADLFLVSHQSK